MPDPSANPYLAFSAMLMAGIDGIKNKIEPPEPVDKDLYELPPDEAADVPTVPGSLDAVLNNLEADHEFLSEGGVFTEDLIETWIDYKRTKEIDAVRLRPTPHEFEMYFDVLDGHTARKARRRARRGPFRFQWRTGGGSRTRAALRLVARSRSWPPRGRRFALLAVIL